MSGIAEDNLRRTLYKRTPNLAKVPPPRPYTTLTQPANEKLRLKTLNISLSPLDAQAKQESTVASRLVSEGLTDLANQVSSTEYQARLAQNAAEVAQSTETTAQLKKALDELRSKEILGLDSKINEELRKQGITKADLQRNPRLRASVTKWKREIYASVNKGLESTEQASISETQRLLKESQEAGRAELSKNIASYEAEITPVVEQAITSNKIQKVVNNLANRGVVVVDGDNISLKKPLSSLSSGEIEDLKKVGFEISQENIDAAVKVEKAESLARRGVVTIDSDKMSLRKSVADLTPSEIKELNSLGFTVTQKDVESASSSNKQQKVIDALIGKGIVSSDGNMLSLNTSLTNLSASDIAQLNKLGFSIAQSDVDKAAIVSTLFGKGIISENGNTMTVLKPLKDLTPTEVQQLNKIGFNITKKAVSEAKAIETMNRAIITQNKINTIITKSQQETAKSLVKNGILIAKTENVNETVKTTYTLNKPLSVLSDVEISDLKNVGFKISSTQISQVNAYRELNNAGAIKVKDGQITVIKPINQLSDTLYKAAQTLGLQGEGTGAAGKGISYQIYDWMKKNAPEGASGVILGHAPLIGSFRSKLDTSKAGYTRVADTSGVFLGGMERSIVDPLNFVVGGLSQLTGKKVTLDYRSVSPETFDYLNTLSTPERLSLEVASVGGYALGTYVSTLGVGALADLTFTGAKAIAPTIAAKIGVSTPVALNKIASTIASHPDLTRIVAYGTIAGVSNADLVNLYSQWQEGKIDNSYFARTIAERSVGIVSGIKGFEAGGRASRQFREWFNTRGRELIPLSEIVRPETLNNLKTGKQSFPYYSEKLPIQKWSKEYKDLAKKLTAEGYLGSLAPNEYRIWHASGDVWKTRLYEPTSAGYGDFLPQLGTKTGEFGTVYKFPGLFLSPEPSPYFFKVGGAGPTSGIPKKLGLPGGRGNPYLISVDAMIDVMPSKMNRAQIWEWLTNQAGKKSAYIPPIGMISREMEAILPSNSVMVKVGQGWYTNYAGHYVLVDKYVLVPSELANQISSMKLPKGMSFTSAESVIKSSSPITRDAILAWGFLPSDASRSGYSTSVMSNETLSALAKQYNISESEARSIVSSLGVSVGDLQTSLSTKTTNTSAYDVIKDVTMPSNPVTISDLTPTLSVSAIEIPTGTSSISEIPISPSEPSPTSPSEQLPVSPTEPSPTAPTEPLPTSPTEPVTAQLTDSGRLSGTLNLPDIDYDPKTRQFKHLKLFEVKLTYRETSANYKIKSNSFHGAAREALLRKQTKQIPVNVLVKPVYEQ